MQLFRTPQVVVLFDNLNGCNFFVLYTPSRHLNTGTLNIFLLCGINTDVNFCLYPDVFLGGRGVVARRDEVVHEEALVRGTYLLLGCDCIKWLGWR